MTSPSVREWIHLTWSIWVFSISHGGSGSTPSYSSAGTDLQCSNPEWAFEALSMTGNTNEGWVCLLLFAACVWLSASPLWHLRQSAVTRRCRPECRLRRLSLTLMIPLRIYAPHRIETFQRALLAKQHVFILFKIIVRPHPWAGNRRRREVTLSFRRCDWSV